MISCRVLFSYIAGLWYAAIAAYGQPSQTIVLPPVALAAAETAQINVMSSAANYPGWSLVTPCSASVTFYGADGSVIGAPTTLVVGGTLGPVVLGEAAQIFSAQLPYASTGVKASSTVISAQIALAGNPFTASTPSPPIPVCAVAFSLQTFDAVTGVTHAYVTGEAAQDNTNVATIGAVSVLPCLSGHNSCEMIFSWESTPTQVIVLPPVRLASTETAQIDLISSVAGFTGVPAASCDGSMRFFGADGSAIGTTANFLVGGTTPPGVVSAQLPYVSSGATGSPATVSAQIALTPHGAVLYPASAVPKCVVAFSMKTFDTATGVTHAFVTGQSVQDTASTATAGPVSAPARRPPRNWR